MDQRKNILLVVVDQWRGDTLPMLGHPLVKTPNIEALAAEGVTFVCHDTQAVPCGPGRASLLTGQYMMNHRASPRVISPHEVNAANKLSRTPAELSASSL